MKPLAEIDEGLLCGRGREIEAAVNNCRAERLTVVTGESGSGVSSLLAAGVVPALKREGFIVARFEDWQGRLFVGELREAVANAVREQADPGFYARDEPLDSMFEYARTRTGRRLAVVLDQFEDYLRCHVHSQISESFDAELASAIAGRRGVFVIGLQEESIPAFRRLEQHVPNLLGHHIRLPLLTVEDAKEAAVREAAAREMEVEPAVLDALTAGPVLVREGLVRPFFLKTGLEQLLDAAQVLKRKVVTLAMVEGRGGADRLVMESLDGAIGEMGSTHVELLFRFCTLLVSKEGHRLAVTEKFLTSYAGKLNRFVPTLLAKTQAMGLMRTIDMPDAVRYEVARECLTPILYDWWERREAAIVARRKAIFRVTSISLALGAIGLMYLVWIYFGMK